MQIVASIMANSQKTTANKTTTSFNPKILCSPAGTGDGVEHCGGERRRSGLRQTTHTLKCHLTNWSSDLAKKREKSKARGWAAIEKPSRT